MSKRGKYSFHDWCVDNNHQEYLDRWDYDLNKINPQDVSFKSHNKYYFKCLKHPEHHSELKKIDNIVVQPGSILCKQCNSFGQYLKDIGAFDEWDMEANNYLNPMDIPKNMNARQKYIFMKCKKTDYHGTYKTDCVHYVNGCRCPYCRNLKIHPFDSLGAKYPISVQLWSEKNEKSPFEYSPTSTNEKSKVWWKCENGIHEDFYKSAGVMSRDGFHCPICSSEKKASYLESKVKCYFEDKGYTVLTERECNILPFSPITNRPMPYDNEIVELKLICEVNGWQHYRGESCSWYKHRAQRENRPISEYVEQRANYDKYKEEFAKNNGYDFLIIPYWSEKNDEYKKIIDEKINLIAQ